MSALRRNHWFEKRYAKFCCKEHDLAFLQAGCQSCVDGCNAFMTAEMKRKHPETKGSKEKE